MMAKEDTFSWYTSYIMQASSTSNSDEANGGTFTGRGRPGPHRKKILR